MRLIRIDRMSSTREKELPVQPTGNVPSATNRRSSSGRKPKHAPAPKGEATARPARAQSTGHKPRFTPQQVVKNFSEMLEKPERRDNPVEHLIAVWESIKTGLLQAWLLPHQGHPMERSGVLTEDLTPSVEQTFEATCCDLKEQILAKAMAAGCYGEVLKVFIGFEQAKKDYAYWTAERGVDIGLFMQRNRCSNPVEASWDAMERAIRALDSYKSLYPRKKYVIAHSPQLQRFYEILLAADRPLVTKDLIRRMGGRCSAASVRQYVARLKKKNIVVINHGDGYRLLHDA